LGIQKVKLLQKANIYQIFDLNFRIIESPKNSILSYEKKTRPIG